MNCQDFEQLIALYIEGDLTVSEVSQVEAHTATCLSCSRFAKELQESQTALKSFGPGDFDDKVLDNLRRSIMSQISARPIVDNFWSRIFDFRNWRYAVASVLLAALVLSASLYFFKSPGSSRQATAGNDGPARKFEQPAEKAMGTNSIKVKAKEPPKQIKREVNRNRFKNLVAEHRSTSEKYSPVDLPRSYDMDPILEIGPKSLPEEITAQTEAAPPVRETKIKIEFQTRDPNIRIIWFLDRDADHNNSRIDNSL